MYKKNKKIYKFTGFLSIIIVIFLLFYYFINDNSKNNYAFNNIKDLSASISKITSFSFFKKSYDNDIINEINKDYEKEIKELKKTLELKELNSDKEFINAIVIKRSMDYFYDIITINKGLKDNIKEGSIVINSDGLVGKVIKVNNKSSDVKLLTSLSDNYVSISFNYENNNYYGLLSSYNHNKNELILKNVIGDFDKEKIKNINVVTSGLGDSFSSGILIGKIKNVYKDEFGLSNIIILTPSVNFDSLNIVSVVVGDK